MVTSLDERRREGTESEASTSNSTSALLERAMDDALELRTPDEIRQLLSRPFRPEVIRSRKIAGRPIAYLTTAAVRERLDRATNTWSFRIVDRRFESLMLSRWNNETKQSEYREVQVYTVVGELEIPELGVRQAIGLQEMDEGSGADLLQGAASDALKKAAKLFDVGLRE